MNALELADSVEPLVLTSFHETQYIGRKAADMLRRQHEAIKVLREDLAALLDDYDAQSISDAKQTLTDTENLT